ncbi:hypothetical protein [Streptomyces sp. NPDC003395]
MSDYLEEQAIRAGRIDRIRAALLGVTVDTIKDDRLQDILSGTRLPNSLEYALIAEATGHTVDWLLHGRLPRSDTSVACTAIRYGGRDLCGCEDCIEHTAEEASQDGC